MKRLQRANEMEESLPVNLQRLSEFVTVSSSDTGCSALRTDCQPTLCGVTRVGLLAKGLLIKGDMDLELVLMCRERPTKTLLSTVSGNLPLQIQVTSTRGRRSSSSSRSSCRTRRSSPKCRTRIT